MPRGKYIVIEGNDGTGKSTQVEKIRERLAEQGIESIEFHEPAGTPTADAIRTIIKNGDLARSKETNLLLFTAARHEIWRNAQKKLQQGVWLVAARNYFSTLAYQGHGEGLSLELIEQTTQTFTDKQYMSPDLAVILTLDHETRNERITERGELHSPDTFESRDENFQTRVNDGYLQIAKGRHLPVIDASQSIDDVTNEIWNHIKV